MPLSELKNQTYDGYTDFRGGVDMLLDDPDANACAYLENFDIRTGQLTTRAGVKRAFPQNVQGLTAGFYFNFENAKYNDATHTGFWFPFEFATSTQFSTGVQGVAYIKAPTWTKHKIFIIADQVCLLVDGIYATQIPTSETIAADERPIIVQADQFVFMFRGDDKTTLRWDFSAAGFTPVPAAATEDNCPNARGAIYHLGRLWAWLDDDDIAASDVLATSEWDLALNRFSITRGDGFKITAMLPVDQNTIIVAKNRGISLITNVAEADLANIGRESLSTTRGVVGPRALCQFGAQVWYLDRGGVFRLTRNQFGNLAADDVSLSLKIQPLIDRINWAEAEKAQIFYFDNRVHIAVPMDGATHNNTLLMYDTLLDKWIGLWTGQPLTPVQAFESADGFLQFVGNDGVIRQMYSDIPADSDDPIKDTQIYSPTGRYVAGDYVRDSASSTTVYKCLANTPTFTTVSGGNPIYHPPTESAYWEVVTDPQHIYDIRSEVITRWLRWNDMASEKRLGRGEVAFEHQNPKVSLSVLGENPYEEKSLFSDVEYDRTKYDVADTPDWDASNVNLDFRNAHRQDYALLLDAGGIYMDANGIDLNVWARHSLRWMTRFLNNRGIRLKLVNTRGKVSVATLMVQADMQRFAARRR